MEAVVKLIPNLFLAHTRARAAIHKERPRASVAEQSARSRVAAVVSSPCRSCGHQSPYARRSYSAGGTFLASPVHRFGSRRHFDRTNHDDAAAYGSCVVFRAVFCSRTSPPCTRASRRRLPICARLPGASVLPLSVRLPNNSNSISRAPRCMNSMISAQRLRRCAKDMSTSCSTTTFFSRVTPTAILRRLRFEVTLKTSRWRFLSGAARFSTPSIWPCARPKHRCPTPRTRIIARRSRTSGARPLIRSTFRIWTGRCARSPARRIACRDSTGAVRTLCARGKRRVRRPRARSRAQNCSAHLRCARRKNRVRAFGG